MYSFQLHFTVISCPNLVLVNYNNYNTLYLYLPILITTHSSPLTVRYGTRLGAAILYNDDHDDEKENVRYPQHDTCPNNTVQCDAITDCLLGTDETNCGEQAHAHTRAHTQTFTRTRLIQGQMVRKDGQTLDCQKDTPKMKNRLEDLHFEFLYMGLVMGIIFYGTHVFKININNRLNLNLHQIISHFIYAILLKQAIQSAFQQTAHHLNLVKILDFNIRELCNVI